MLSRLPAFSLIAASAARELDEARDGRKARRDGQATPTRLQTDLVEALAALGRKAHRYGNVR